MKKKFVKALGTLLIGVFVATGSINAKAATINDSKSLNIEGATLQKISTSSIPEGVTPLKFNSIEEASAYIKKAKSELDVNNKIAKEKFLKASLSKTSSLETNKLGTMVAYSNPTSSQTKDCGSLNGITHVQMQVIYQYYSGTHYFASCTSITTYLTGVTYGVSWAQQGSGYSSIIDQGRTLACSVTGAYTTYIMIPQGPFSWTESKSLYQEFYYN